MIRVKQIKVNILCDNDDCIRKVIAKKLGISVSEIDGYNILKRSIDARYKPDIFYIYEVDLSCKNEEKVIKKNNSNNDISKSISSCYIMPSCGDIEIKHRPVIVGSGPAGLFCAYLLAVKGYKPLIIER